jgi:hypothetical protein
MAKDLQATFPKMGLVHLSGQFSAGCEAPICRAFLLIHSAFGYGFVESRNIWGLSLGRNFDRKGERGPKMKGLSARNILYMKQFDVAYPDFAITQLRSKLLRKFPGATIWC